mmetsp:Transcript_986/g.3356  ORF Transcript_986/g.3356 Transcript_986/m.3356 type:complete len:399 (-) Transcript_986:114-1310(-)
MSSSSKIVDLIAEKAKAKEVWVSYEFFPPRSETGVKNLESRWLRMKESCEPMFADVTWGAGGSTSSLTLELTLKLKKMGLNPNMHLTCTNVQRDEVVDALKTCRDHGIRNVVALRGDPPVGVDKWEATDQSFTCALDLVKFIRKAHGDYFNVAVAGYPEGHPDVIVDTKGRELSDAEKVRCRVCEDGKTYVCSDADYAKELAYLKKKVDAGSDVVITQMFFDVATFESFVTAARAAGITCPIIPGIMVIQAAAGFQKMTNFCKTRVPPHLSRAVADCQNDDKQLKDLGVAYGVDMATKLIQAGAPGLHFYTLNLEASTLAILRTIGKAKQQKKKRHQRPRRRREQQKWQGPTRHARHPRPPHLPRHRRPRPRRRPRRPTALEKDRHEATVRTVATRKK